jgi:hypothetical protein
MRLTVGPLPAAVYWRRRAAVVLVIGLVVTPFAVTCGRHGGGSTPGAIPSAGTTAPTPTTSATDAGVSPSPLPTGIDEPGAGSPTGGAQSTDTAVPPEHSSGAPPPVVATVECTDDELLLTAAASPTPARYAGNVTLTLIVRNTADHPCFRDVGSAAQELQVRQDEAYVWSSDSCGLPRISDVRTFGPNIESRFWRTWNTYRIVPHECDTPEGATPAAAGTYQVVARLGTKLSEPTSFEIRV